MLKKVGHILLTALLLFSTIGMTINLHLCKHSVYDVGVFNQAESCCAPNHTSHLQKEHHCDLDHHNQNDCENKTIHFDKVDNFVSSDTDFHFENISLFTLCAYLFVLVDVNSNSDSGEFDFPDLNISPPRIQVVLSLLQTYLN
nr:hypothetical protein [uncultured Carboxylicivirga sp.]